MANKWSHSIVFSLKTFLWDQFVRISAMRSQWVDSWFQILWYPFNFKENPSNYLLPVAKSGSVCFQVRGVYDSTLHGLGTNENPSVYTQWEKPLWATIKSFWTRFKTFKRNTANVKTTVFQWYPGPKRCSRLLWWKLKLTAVDSDHILTTITLAKLSVMHCSLFGASFHNQTWSKLFLTGRCRKIIIMNFFG